MILKCHTLLAVALTFTKVTTNAFTINTIYSRTTNINDPTTRDALQSRPFARMPIIGLRPETLLRAKKGGKRRKRKDGAGNTKKKNSGNAKQSNQASPTTQTTNEETVDLPGFDLVEDIDLPTAESGNLQMSSANLSVDMDDPDAVLRAMQQTNGDLPASSTRDLLRSRNTELEQKYVVDNVTLKVPTLAEYTKRSSPSGGAGAGQQQQGGGGGAVANPQKVGKKAARAAARKDAAIEAEGSGGIDNPVIATLLKKIPKVPNLPFTNASIRDNNGDFSVIKIIENAAWAGIYTLVIWEIYINSPLFTRALPMAPVVFSDPATMT